MNRFAGYGDETPLSRRSDEELMRRAQEDEVPSGFEVLRERYDGAVKSYLLRMFGGGPEVEPLVREVFARAYRFRQTYRYPGKFSTWLFTITRNLAINEQRRRRRG